MKCPKCNFEVSESSKFCPECGEKMPEAVSQETPGQEVATPEIVVDEKALAEKKRKKKKLIKVIVIPSAIVLFLGLAFLVLYLINPNCMFYHKDPFEHVITQESTCTEYGAVQNHCPACDKYVGGYRLDLLDHDYGTIVCGEKNTCVNCGETKVIEHEDDYTNKCCKHCGQSYYTVDLPVTPHTATDYDYYGNIEEIVIITEISLSSNGYVYYKVKRAYHENGNNYSAKARIAWKLYNSDGTVVDSDTDYSNASIATGEQTDGAIRLNLEKWGDYRFEIINTK